jgi:hypothetical protein
LSGLLLASSDDTVSTVSASQPVTGASPLANAERPAMPSPLQHVRMTFSDKELTANRSEEAETAQVWRDTFNFIPPDSSALAQRGGYRRERGSRDRDRSGAAAAIIIGAAATIAGTAVLVYANRPECSINPGADGCGYGTKVVGGSVLAGGVVGLLVGAATWR